MNVLKKLALVALVTLSGTMFTLASVDDLPTVTRDGKLYHYYEVQPKETIYSLTHKLGVTTDEIIAANPAVADGLKAHTVLYFPAKKAVKRTHTASKGETIYGISHRYGLTVDQLIKLNPVLNDGLRPGMVLIIEGSAPEHTRVEGDINHTHRVAEGETFYSIAHRYGITVADLEKANPSVSVLQAGSTINIPVPTVTEVAVVPDNNGGTIVETVDTPTSTTIKEEPAPVETKPVTPTVEPAPAPILKNEKKEVRMAILLPFMLNQGKTEKNAHRSTEFYEGFLLAVDSMRQSGNKVRIYTYDTHNNIDTLRKIISYPAIKDVDVMIVPDNAEQLKMLSQFANKHSIYMFNPFAVHDTGYTTNEWMLQANIPSEMMLKKAIDTFVGSLVNARPVIVKRKTGNADRQEFVDMLTATLTKKGIKYSTIEYTGKLAATNLEDLPTDKELIFIPVSSRAAEFNRMFPALSNLYDKCLTDGGSVKLFGYPDWIVFRGEAASNLHKLDTTIYSRFYCDPEGWDVKAVEDAFIRWYGHPMDKTVPRQAMLGFDSGMFLLNWIKTTDGDLSSAIPSYNGVQNSFNFITPAGDKGHVNDVIYMINIRPSGLSDALRY